MNFEKWILSNEDEETFEEVQVRVGRKPDEPTEQEIEEHFARNHVPFRSWCPICVKAKAEESPHRSAAEEERRLPEHSFDYCFPGDELGLGTRTVPGTAGRKGRALR